MLCPPHKGSPKTGRGGGCHLQVTDQPPALRRLESEVREALRHIPRLHILRRIPPPPLLFRLAPVLSNGPQPARSALRRGPAPARPAVAHGAGVVVPLGEAALELRLGQHPHGPAGVARVAHVVHHAVQEGHGPPRRARHAPVEGDRQRLRLRLPRGERDRPRSGVGVTLRSPCGAALNTLAE